MVAAQGSDNIYLNSTCIFLPICFNAHMSRANIIFHCNRVPSRYFELPLYPLAKYFKRHLFLLDISGSSMCFTLPKSFHLTRKLQMWFPYLKPFSVSVFINNVASLGWDRTPNEESGLHSEMQSGATFHWDDNYKQECLCPPLAAHYEEVQTHKPQWHTLCGGIIVIYSIHGTFVESGDCL